MCGIYGIISHSCSKGKDNFENALIKGKQNHKRMAHRGPDWEGDYTSSAVYIAHQRLSIIGATSGSQPIICTGVKSLDSQALISIGEIVLAVNGEIYNYKKLKEEVNGELAKHNIQYIYTTESDCEVIIPLYLCYTQYNKQENSIKYIITKLQGMFSFILYNKGMEQVIIARDTMGITPLYYGYDMDGYMHIASEAKAFDADIIPFHFKPGHYMNIKILESENKLADMIQFATTLDIDVYNISQDTHIFQGDIDAYSESIKQLLINAVDKRMQSDVPFGILLSGGLDSSLVASIASKILKGEIASKYGVSGFGQLTTFAIGLEGSPDLDAAQVAADYLGTQHYNFKFTIEDGISALRNMIYHLETYDVTTIRASIPMYLLARKIKSMGIKMVLSGEGSDELFGGYLYFLNAPDAIEHSMECLQRLRDLSYFDNLRANKSTMAWGIEARVPFQDLEFIKLGMTIPAFLKRFKNIEKWILRNAFVGDYLPDSILWRQKEQFSDGVGYSWIDSLKEIAKNSVSERMMLTASHRYPHNTPTTHEEYYYRKIYEELFPGKGWEFIGKKWIPKTSWSGVSYDPSGRAQSSHVNKY